MAHIDRLEVEEKAVLWADRKRYLGMPISFTRYSIDEDRLYIKTGLLRTMTDEVLLYRIMDVRSSQTLWQKIFGVGTVCLSCADHHNQEVTLQSVKGSQKLHRYLSDLIEKSRRGRGIDGREMFGAAGDAIDDGCPDCDC